MELSRCRVLEDNYLKKSASLNRIDYFKDKGINIKLPLNLKSGYKIISCNCNASIQGFENKKGKLSLDISIYVKTLYNVENSTALSIKQHIVPFSETLILPKKIDGFFHENIDVERKIGVECKIENVEILEACGTYIKLFMILISNIKIDLSQGIFYLIEDGSEKIYSSNALGGELRRVNTKAEYFKTMVFSDYSEGFYYRDKNSIYEHFLLNDNEREVLNYEGLQWYAPLYRNYFLIYINNNDEGYFSIINVSSKREELIFKDINSPKIEKIKCKNNILAFSNIYGEEEELIIQDIYREVLYRKKQSYRELYIYEETPIILIDMEDSLQYIDFESNIDKEIKLPYTSFKIKEVKFKDKGEAIILGEDENINYIISLSLRDEGYKLLHKTKNNISTIDINNLNQVVYAEDDKGLYNIYYLDKEAKSRIFLRTFSRNIYLKCRR